jgi:glycosyltransferase involved in cell wall biosynthesis
MAESYTVLHVITPHRFGGAERIAANLSRALMERGHRIVVAAPPRVPDFAKYLEQLGVEYQPLGIAGKVNPLAPRRIAGLARRIGADIIHTHLSSASVHGVKAARRLGAPAICHVHGMNSLRWYRGASLVLTGTRGMAAHLLRQGLAERDLRVVPYGIPQEPFDHLKPAGDLRAELGLAPDDRAVGVLAGLVWRKGHVHLLEAMAALRDRQPRLHCLVIGSGAILGELKARAEELKVADHVHWLGWRLDALDLLQALDVLALPSTEIEGFGLCIVEAALVGVPAVASRLPGVDEAVLDGRTGLLVPPGDSAALADAIDRLLGDEDLRRDLGEAARKRAREEFTIQRMAADVEAVYRAVLGR